MAEYTMTMADNYHPHGAVTQLQDLIQLQHLASTLGNRITSTAQVAGVNRSLSKSRGLDFEEVRHYQQGDDVRAIDWRVTAKTGKPHTKLFREEKERPVYLVVDQSPSLFFGSKHCFKSVMATHLAAALAWSALRHGDRVGGLVFNHLGHQEIAARRAQKQVLRFCQLLTTYNTQLINTRQSAAVQETLTQALAQVSQVAKPGSRVMIISDFSQYSADAKALLSHLSQRAEVVCFCVYDVLEQALPALGQARFASGLAGGTSDTNTHQQAAPFTVNTDDAPLREAFSAAFDAQQTLLKADMQQMRVAYVPVPTHACVLDTLRGILREERR